MLGLMARKLGMTQVFDDVGDLVPVTVMRIDPNIVISQKSKEKDGYSAVLLGIDDLKAAKVSKPYAGQFPEGISPKRTIKEFRDFEKEVSQGDILGPELFENIRYVDVSGISKGKGFQGVVKRFKMGGGHATHGSKFHREMGATGQGGYPHKTFKNRKMPGRMGRENVTAQNLRVVKVDTEKKLLMVQGSVPGINKSLVVIKAAVKKYG